MKKYILAVALLILIAAGCSKNTAIIPTPEVSDPGNTSYIIEGKAITLKNGVSENLVDGTTTTATIKTKIFESNTQGDLNGDGLPDTAVILTQDTGGSGTFYYIAVALKTDRGYTGTNAVLLGDRIAPQNNQIEKGLLTVNYADRKSEEDFSVQPSVGKSLYLEYFKGALTARPEALQTTAPYPYTEISSPLVVTGQARGSWFFEASFPVLLKDSDGKIIAQGIAQAKGDWMKSQFVPFTATLTFTKPVNSTTGSLILKKDNPSDLPQNDAVYEMPIIFK